MTWASRGRTLAVLIAGLFAACGEDPIGPPPPILELPRELTVAEQRVIEASNRFAFDLLREVRRRTEAPNLFLSPLSASMALGMTLNGAAGQTFDQMRATLGFGPLTQEEINTSYRDLIQLLLNLDRGVEMRIANSTWARKGFTFEPGFFTTVRDFFDAETRELDFDLPGAVDTINAWVKAKTRGRIDSIVEEIDPLDIMFLLNAVYFKGNWTTAFDPARTRHAPFHLDTGGTVEVGMMFGEEMPVSLGWVDRVQLAELPYGGRAFGLVVVLPPEGMRLADFVTGLDADTWAAWMGALQPVEEAMVALPKFRLSYDDALKAPLQALGMVDAFDPERADFSKLTAREDAYISAVRMAGWTERSGGAVPEVPGP
ncbi:MAG: serpin family protein, partial [Gemmatimonadetes bacterium]|nr:serpin family protein [Gemmatimonadota bacterium]